ncbi:Rossmann-fold NAD(P)-binding domain-containing protein [Cnuella takakiae]|uniref:hypothetical protein n=1 Tax=Cnuella takakiae TaxID=1302690 RepID=UPI001C1F6006|nr:hypothetical protein [Cnuella takakiae]
MFPAQEGKASWVLREELAEAAAQVLNTEGHQNKTYPLTNITSVSFSDIAKEMSAVLGKEVEYKSPSVTQFEDIMKEAGVPQVYIGMFTMWATAETQDALELEDETLSSFLGRKPTTVKQFIELIYR